MKHFPHCVVACIVSYWLGLWIDRWNMGWCWVFFIQLKWIMERKGVTGLPPLGSEPYPLLGKVMKSTSILVTDEVPSPLKVSSRSFRFSIRPTGIRPKKPGSPKQPVTSPRDWSYINKVRLVWQARGPNTKVIEDRIIAKNKIKKIKSCLKR